MTHNEDFKAQRTPRREVPKTNKTHEQDNDTGSPDGECKTIKSKHRTVLTEKEDKCITTPYKDSQKAVEKEHGTHQYFQGSFKTNRREICDHLFPGVGNNSI